MRVSKGKKSDEIIAVAVDNPAFTGDDGELNGADVGNGIFGSGISKKWKVILLVATVCVAGATTGIYFALSSSEKVFDVCRDTKPVNGSLVVSVSQVDELSCVASRASDEELSVTVTIKEDRTVDCEYETIIIPNVTGGFQINGPGTLKDCAIQVVENGTLFFKNELDAENVQLALKDNTVFVQAGMPFGGANSSVIEQGENASIELIDGASAVYETCPDGWWSTSELDKCYRIYPASTDESAISAQERCTFVSPGASLGYVTNKFELDFVEKLSGYKKVDVWTGMSVQNNTVYSSGQVVDLESFSSVPADEDGCLILRLRGDFGETLDVSHFVVQQCTEESETATLLCSIPKSSPFPDASRVSIRGGQILLPSYSAAVISFDEGRIPPPESCVDTKLLVFQPVARSRQGGQRGFWREFAWDSTVVGFELRAGVELDANQTPQNVLVDRVMLGNTYAGESSFGVNVFMEAPLDGFTDVVKAEGGDGNVAFADLNGDGLLDAIVASRYEKEIKFYVNVGTSTTPDFKLSGDNPFSGVDGSKSNTPLAFADLDKDGKLDAFYGQFDGTILYLHNDGSLTSPKFTRNDDMNPLNGVKVASHAHIAFADLFGKGLLDAYIATYHSGIVRYINKGSSTQPRFEVDGSDLGNPLGAINFYEMKISFMDFDSDGDLDVFVGSMDKLVLYSNIGTATRPRFTRDDDKNPFHDVGGKRLSVAFADLDSDGYKDAFVSSIAGDVRYFAKTGGTRFTSSRENPQIGEVAVQGVSKRLPSVVSIQNAAPQVGQVLVSNIKVVLMRTDKEETFYDLATDDMVSGCGERASCSSDDDSKFTCKLRVFQTKSSSLLDDEKSIALGAPYHASIGLDLTAQGTCGEVNQRTKEYFLRVQTVGDLTPGFFPLDVDGPPLRFSTVKTETQFIRGPLVTKEAKLPINRGEFAKRFMIVPPSQGGSVCITGSIDVVSGPSRDHMRTAFPRWGFWDTFKCPSLCAPHAVFGTFCFGGDSGIQQLVFDMDLTPPGSPLSYSAFDNECASILQVQVQRTYGGNKTVLVDGEEACTTAPVGIVDGLGESYDAGERAGGRRLYYDARRRLVQDYEQDEDGFIVSNETIPELLQTLIYDGSNKRTLKVRRSAFLPGDLTFNVGRHSKVVIQGVFDEELGRLPTMSNPSINIGAFGELVLENIGTIVDGYIYNEGILEINGGEWRRNISSQDNVVTIGASGLGEITGVTLGASVSMLVNGRLELHSVIQEEGARVSVAGILGVSSLELHDADFITKLPNGRVEIIELSRLYIPTNPEQVVEFCAESEQHPNKSEYGKNLDECMAACDSNPDQCEGVFYSGFSEQPYCQLCLPELGCSFNCSESGAMYYDALDPAPGTIVDRNHAVPASNSFLTISGSVDSLVECKVWCGYYPTCEMLEYYGNTCYLYEHPSLIWGNLFGRDATLILRSKSESSTEVEPDFVNVPGACSNAASQIPGELLPPVLPQTLAGCSAVCAASNIECRAFRLTTGGECQLFGERDFSFQCQDDDNGAYHTRLHDSWPALIKGRADTNDLGAGVAKVWCSIPQLDPSHVVQVEGEGTFYFNERVASFHVNHEQDCALVCADLEDCVGFQIEDKRCYPLTKYVLDEALAPGGCTFDAYKRLFLALWRTDFQVAERKSCQARESFQVENLGACKSLCIAHPSCSEFGYLNIAGSAPQCSIDGGGCAPLGNVQNYTRYVLESPEKSSSTAYYLQVERCVTRSAMPPQLLHKFNKLSDTRTNLDMCQLLCDMTRECVAFSHSDNDGCHLYPELKALAPLGSGDCNSVGADRRTLHIVTKAFSEAGKFGFIEIPPLSSQRVEFAGEPEEMDEEMTEAQCLDQCSNSNLCQGVQYSGLFDRCELYLNSARFRYSPQASSSPDGSFKSFVKYSEVFYKNLTTMQGELVLFGSLIESGLPAGSLRECAQLCEYWHKCETVFFFASECSLFGGPAVRVSADQARETGWATRVSRSPIVNVEAQQSTVCQDSGAFIMDAVVFEEGKCVQLCDSLDDCGYFTYSRTENLCSLYNKASFFQEQGCSASDALSLKLSYEEFVEKSTPQFAKISRAAAAPMTLCFTTESSSDVSYYTQLECEANCALDSTCLGFYRKPGSNLCFLKFQQDELQPCTPGIQEDVFVKNRRASFTMLSGRCPSDDPINIFSGVTSKEACASLCDRIFDCRMYEFSDDSCTLYPSTRTASQQQGGDCGNQGELYQYYSALPFTRLDNRFCVAATSELTKLQSMDIESCKASCRATQHCNAFEHDRQGNCILFSETDFFECQDTARDLYISYERIISQAGAHEMASLPYHCMPTKGLPSGGAPASNRLQALSVTPTCISSCMENSECAGYRWINGVCQQLTKSDLEEHPIRECGLEPDTQIGVKYKVYPYKELDGACLEKPAFDDDVVFFEKDVTECAAICEALAACRYFTIDEGGGECRLYKAQQGDIETTCQEEGVRAFINERAFVDVVTWFGEPSDIYADIPDLSYRECAAVCSLSPDCNAFMHDWQTRRFPGFEETLVDPARLVWVNDAGNFYSVVIKKKRTASSIGGFAVRAQLGLNDDDYHDQKVILEDVIGQPGQVRVRFWFKNMCLTSSGDLRVCADKSQPEEIFALTRKSDDKLEIKSIETGRCLGFTFANSGDVAELNFEACKTNSGTFYTASLPTRIHISGSRQCLGRNPQNVYTKEFFTVGFNVAPPPITVTKGIMPVDCDSTDKDQLFTYLFQSKQFVHEEEISGTGFANADEAYWEQRAQEYAVIPPVRRTQNLATSPLGTFVSAKLSECIKKCDETADCDGVEQGVDPGPFQNLCRLVRLKGGFFHTDIDYDYINREGLRVYLNPQLRWAYKPSECWFQADVERARIGIVQPIGRRLRSHTHQVPAAAEAAAAEEEDEEMRSLLNLRIAPKMEPGECKRQCQDQPNCKGFRYCYQGTVLDEFIDLFDAPNSLIQFPEYICYLMSAPEAKTQISSFARMQHGECVLLNGTSPLEPCVNEVSRTAGKSMWMRRNPPAERQLRFQFLDTQNSQNNVLLALNTDSSTSDKFLVRGRTIRLADDETQCPMTFHTSMIKFSSCNAPESHRYSRHTTCRLSTYQVSPPMNLESIQSPGMCMVDSEETCSSKLGLGRCEANGRQAGSSWRYSYADNELQSATSPADGEERKCVSRKNGALGIGYCGNPNSLWGLVGEEMNQFQFDDPLQPGASCIDLDTTCVRQGSCSTDSEAKTWRGYGSENDAFELSLKPTAIGQDVIDAEATYQLWLWSDFGKGARKLLAAVDRLDPTVEAFNRMIRKSAKKTQKLSETLGSVVGTASNVEEVTETATVTMKRASTIMRIMEMLPYVGPVAKATQLKRITKIGAKIMGKGNRAFGAALEAISSLSDTIETAIEKLSTYSGTLEKIPAIFKLLAEAVARLSSEAFMEGKADVMAIYTDMMSQIENAHNQFIETKDKLDDFVKIRLNALKSATKKVIRPIQVAANKLKPILKFMKALSFVDKLFDFKLKLRIPTGVKIVWWPFSVRVSYKNIHFGLEVLGKEMKKIKDFILGIPIIGYLYSALETFVDKILEGLFRKLGFNAPQFGLGNVLAIGDDIVDFVNELQRRVMRLASVGFGALTPIAQQTSRPLNLLFEAFPGLDLDEIFNFDSQCYYNNEDDPSSVLEKCMGPILGNIPFVNVTEVIEIAMASNDFVRSDFYSKMYDEVIALVPTMSCKETTAIPIPGLPTIGAAFGLDNSFGVLSSLSEDPAGNQFEVCSKLDFDRDAASLGRELAEVTGEFNGEFKPTLKFHNAKESLLSIPLPSGLWDKVPIFHTKFVTKGGGGFTNILFTREQWWKWKKFLCSSKNINRRFREWSQNTFGCTRRVNGELWPVKPPDFVDDSQGWSLEFDPESIKWVIHNPHYLYPWTNYTKACEEHPIRRHYLEYTHRITIGIPTSTKTAIMLNAENLIKTATDAVEKTGCWRRNENFLWVENEEVYKTCKKLIQLVDKVANVDGWTRMKKSKYWLKETNFWDTIERFLNKPDTPTPLEGDKEEARKKDLKDANRVLRVLRAIEWDIRQEIIAVKGSGIVEDPRNWREKAWGYFSKAVQLGKGAIAATLRFNDYPAESAVVFTVKLEWNGVLEVACNFVVPPDGPFYLVSVEVSIKIIQILSNVHKYSLYCSAKGVFKKLLPNRVVPGGITPVDSLEQWALQGPTRPMGTEDLKCEHYKYPIDSAKKRSTRAVKIKILVGYRKFMYADVCPITIIPTPNPTVSPTNAPTTNPTVSPSVGPTSAPTGNPTHQPTTASPVP